MWTAARSVCVCRREPVSMGEHGCKVILKDYHVGQLEPRPSPGPRAGLEDAANEVKKVTG